MQQEMAKALNERNIAKNDCAKLYEMLELLKAKYQTLTEQKAGQAEELIKSEEEKLSLARALIDLKLEYSQLREKAEKEMAEATSSLESCNNKIEKLEEEIKTLNEDIESKKKLIEELENKLLTETKNNVALQATLQEVRNTLSIERNKNLDLGSELLTLVNQKDFLQRQVNTLQQSLDELNLKMESQSGELKEQVLINEELKAELQTKEHDYLDLRRDKLDVDVESKNYQLELKQVKDESERNNIEFQKEKANIFNKVKRFFSVFFF
jgi:chromosome segregation ATPase